ncbi:MAG TPA: methionyl-tRNA formyltransferase [Anaerolineae bacterium]|nr:methionyl-tRNA formyltransferase [Anaerolineae bacterium]HQK14558.1 methionyl-tRNA formyltransferase [Anaerolineae bacterium]
MGTPEFALPTLEKLATHYALVGVVTQPDRPAGRGRRLVASPVKEFAVAEGIPVFQPERLRGVEAVEHIHAWAPDLIVVAAYGQILRPPVLEIPRFGVLNVHASLLPRWRGASPVQAAILAGDAVTGVTIMKMDEGLDTGPILAQREVPIAPDETGGALEARLAEIGAQLLLEVLPDYLSGRLQPRPQPADGVTITHRMPAEAACIDWTRPAVEVERHVRAFAPTPGAFTDWNGARLKVLQSEVLVADGIASAVPGTVFLWRKSPAVMTGEGALVLVQVQMAGKRPMSGELFVRGRKDILGAVLGSQRPGEE